MATSSATSVSGDSLADPARLGALHRLDIKDSEPEESFNAVTRLAATLFRVPEVNIHLLDDQRQTVKASVSGDRSSDMPLGETFCEHVVRKHNVIIAPDLLEDPRFSGSDHVTGKKGRLRFYAGAPLTTSDGYSIGTLCLTNTEPMDALNDREIELLRQMADVVTQMMELRAAHDQARHGLLRAVEEDALTGLFSRRGILLYLQRLLASESVAVPSVAMIKVQLSRLELVKGGYGAEVRNQLLQQAADRLSSVCTAGELLTRLDDGAFLITRVFSATDHESDSRDSDAWVQQCAHDAEECFRTPLVLSGEEFQVSAVVGIARSLGNEVDAYALLDMVDEAAANAIADDEGKTLQWSDGKQYGYYQDQLSMEKRLRNAVRNEHFELAYHPIVDLQQDNRIVGAEALIRWPQQDGSYVRPDLFIPLAEELGLIHPIGLWVFETACRALKRWRETSNETFWISVNLSPLQLRDRQLPQRLAAIARSIGVSPAHVKLEITESALIEEFDRVAGLIDELIEIGFPLALDDFGTGQSSLSRLIHLPFSVLKVDRAFVNDSPDGNGAAVVASLAGLARSLRLDAVGEGIETEAHESYLRAQGYQLGQGYLYSKPLIGDAFTGYLTS